MRIHVIDQLGCVNPPFLEDLEDTILAKKWISSAFGFVVYRIVMGDVEPQPLAEDTQKLIPIKSVKEESSSFPKIKCKYKRNYRKAWEAHPKLSEWLSPLPSNPERAFCRSCQTTVGAHLRVLLDHAKTRKHINATRNTPVPLEGIEGHSESEEQISQVNDPNLEVILSALSSAVCQRSTVVEDTELNTGKGEEDTGEDTVEDGSRDAPHENTVIVSPELVERFRELQKRRSDIVLKIRHSGALDRDFYEAYLSSNNLTYSALLQLCSSELGIQTNDVVKVRKLPNTTIRTDRNVQNLKSYDELEILTF